MARNRTRRRVLAALGATGVGGLAGCTGGDGSGETEGTTMGTSADVSGTVRIGVLQPVSGDLAYYGNQSMWGFYSGLAYKAGADPIPEVTTGQETVSVGDVDYELYVRDTGFSADAAQTAATNLVTEQDVDMLFGCASSGAARRVITTVVSESGTPAMIGPAASAGLTSSSETCSDIVFRASENTAMDARSGGRYVARESDVSSVYLFGADYSFGRAVVNNYEQVLRQEGVEIAGRRFVERGYSDDWEGLLNNAEESGAEGIVGGFTVATLPSLFTSFLNGDYSFRVFGGFATEITNSAVGATLVQSLGEPLTEEKLSDLQLGPFTTRYHWNQYDNPINDEFVESYTGTYGKVPDLFTSGTFTAASAIVQAVETAGSTDGEDIAAALRGMTVTDTPKGENAYTFQEYNNQARSEMTVADVVPTTDEFADSWGGAVQPSEPVARIAGENATIPQDADNMNCSL